MTSKKAYDTGLALSGGGFRATLFHLGAMWRLNELSLLPTIARIAAVSGGSLLSGVIAARWSRLAFHNGIAANFHEEVVRPIWNFCSMNVDVTTTLSGLLVGTHILERYYRRHLVGDSTLQDMPDYPEFVFNAAHIETGRNWAFSKSCMRTYRLGTVDHPDVQLSNVIAASSAMPPFFPPLILKLNPDDFRRSQYADLFDRVGWKRKVSLTDGGVYDNLGVHSIRDFKTLLISDASGPLETIKSLPMLRWFFQRVLRPIDIAVEQTRALRRRSIIEQFQNGDRSGALWSVTTDVRSYPVTSPFAVRKEWVSQVSSIRTRLNSFTDEEKSRLINWGYLQCDLSIRSYYRSSVDPPSSLPFPQFHFASPPVIRPQCG